MSDNELFALSPLDGRYARTVDSLREYMSEYALIRDRVGVDRGQRRQHRAEIAAVQAEVVVLAERVHSAFRD